MKWLRKLIGTEDLYNQINDLNKYITGVRGELSALKTQSDRILLQVNAITPGLGRVIAKLDPQFGRPEIDPERKAESDKLGDSIIRRLEGEAAAREPYNNV